MDFIIHNICSYLSTTLILSTQLQNLKVEFLTSKIFYIYNQLSCQMYVFSIRHLHIYIIYYYHRAILMKAGNDPPQQEEDEMNLEYVLSYEKFMDADNQASTSFLSEFFRQNQIRKITLNKSIMKVEYAYRRPIHKFFKQNLQKNSNKSSVASFNKSKLAALTEQFGELLPQLLIKLKKKYPTASTSQEQFFKFIETKSGNLPFWALFHRIIKQGPRLKYMIFSKKFLQILGYQLEEAALYFRKYQQTAITYSSNQFLKQITMNFFTQYIQVSKQQEPTDEKMKEIAQKYIIQGQDTLIGKDDMKIKANVRIIFPVPHAIYTELDKIISRQIQESHGINKMQKQHYENDHSKKLFSSLASIVRLPKSLDPVNQSKVCSYRQLSTKDSSKNDS